MTIEKLSLIFLAGIILWFIIRMIIWMFKD